ncbi:glycosyltransferase family 2 protein [Methylicorpusculum sp.]|uniref:glycosyltransferase family 2 protein n=1 Tax=Methylicorpusculum sp. TaxID=2713644 RepID=UPI003520F106
MVTCDTDFVALLNPDAFPVPDCLEHLMAAAISNPGVAAFASLQLFADISNKIDGMGDSYRMSGCFGVRNTGFCCRQLLNRSIPCSAPVRQRRCIGVMRCLRLAGHQALYVHDAIVRQPGSASTGGQHSDFWVYHGHPNLVWAYVKNMPGILMWLLLPLH